MQCKYIATKRFFLVSFKEWNAYFKQDIFTCLYQRIKINSWLNNKVHVNIFIFTYLHLEIDNKSKNKLKTDDDM